jgi:hypothetical protein
VNHHLAFNPGGKANLADSIILSKMGTIDDKVVDDSEGF